MALDKYHLPAVCKGAPVGENMRRQARQMRTRPTPAESAAWEILRDKRCFGLRFRRQQPIGPFIADFYCPALRLAIEVDGGIHETREQRRYDAIREHVVAMLGVTIVRIRNEDVNPEAIQELVRRAGGIRTDP